MTQKMANKTNALFDELNYTCLYKWELIQKFTKAFLNMIHNEAKILTNSGPINNARLEMSIFNSLFHFNTLSIILNQCEK